MALLEAKGLSKTYGSHTALDNISISAGQGKVLGLLGPNGAGKTSFIRIVTQILHADSGTVLFDGKPLAPEHIVQIGYMPEERGLYRKMRIGEQLIYLARLKGLNKFDAEKSLNYWLEKLDIQSWKNRRLEELSKGMQQKVQFIATVMHKPRLLILDEPFSGFDPINTQLIRNEILELKAQGTTFIISTHNMNSVEELCDDIVLLNKGHKLLDGSLKEVQQAHTTNTYRISFKGSLIAFTNALWTGAEIIAKHEEEDRHTVDLRLLGKAKPKDILAAILPHAEIISVNEVIPSMSDIFIRAVAQTQEMAHG